MDGYKLPGHQSDLVAVLLLELKGKGMKGFKTKSLVALGAIVLMSGCVTDGQDYTWTKSGGGNVSQEMALADSECLSQAYQKFRAQPMSGNNCVGLCVENEGGLVSGYRAGAEARQNREMREARERYYESCMAAQGWIKQPVQ